MSDENHSTPAEKDQRVRPGSLSEKFNAMNLLDPRSPTTAFQRTPIQVILRNRKSISTEQSSIEIMPETAAGSPASFFSLSDPRAMEDESLELSASSASYLSLENLTDINSVNLFTDDLSMIVSSLSSSSRGSSEMEYLYPAVIEDVDDDFERWAAEFKEKSPCLVSDEVDRSMEEKSIQPELIEIEQNHITPDHSIITPSKSSEDGSATAKNTSQYNSADSLLENAAVIRKKPLKTMFYTPNPNKKRNPLGKVDNTCPSTPPSHLYGSPQKMVCEKHWKRIQEERKKLGLESDENAQLPLYDITASAPSKLVRKSRLRNRLNNVMS